MLVKTYGSAVSGIDAFTVTMEVNISAGIKFFLVGLPDSAVKESEQRIDSAIRENGWKYPQQRIVINMAPADIRKEGSAYDLPLAVGILAASGQCATERLGKYIMMGELSLDGQLKAIKGVLPMALKAKAEGFDGFIVPRAHNHDRQKPAEHPAATTPRRGPGDHQNTLRGGQHKERDGSHDHTPVPQPAPHYKRRSPCGRRHIPPTWRDKPEPQRRAVPRRVARIQTLRPRGDASASGRQEDNHIALKILSGISRLVHAGGLDEPVPMRIFQLAKQKVHLRLRPRAQRSARGSWPHGPYRARGSSAAKASTATLK